MTKKIEKFSPEVCKQLKFYVYRLLDPRNGETFYVGKGKDNRVFQHIKTEVQYDKDIDDSEEQDDISLKYARIREIRRAGLDVIHIIHRHNMTHQIALQVEGALIDAYSGLSNIQVGHGNNDYGVMNAFQIEQRYNAPYAQFDEDDKCLIISINRSISLGSIYDAVRLAWRLDVERARQAKYILAVEKGLIVGVLIADKWLLATKQHFPELPHDREERYGFIGKLLDEEDVFHQDILKKYLGKRLPEEYRKRGASNPVKYAYKKVNWKTHTRRKNKTPIARVS
ncbi:LEM-3-like GIY-YIG domain-containing protein [Aggregatibacter aphrophilus]|jgi:hypothetical protein|uniref:LEM-3-like GIY-YIG domain-containing protein n=1 Tax=Aggregatibacter aphrophilus TaxID=732 RepID=UPI000AA3A16B|nr:hypothetical protein [Aggregatibacter aphrophilus]